LSRIKLKGNEFNLLETSFFLSRETLIATKMPGMAIWREKLFVSMARNGSSATAFFHIPTNRVIELGTQVEL
jgi:KUP system potassium uptake protein